MSTKLDERYQEVLSFYNKLEELFKASQMVQELFQIPVLNEYRYIARALVDYNQFYSDNDKEKAISKLEVGIAAAYNDILDSIIMTIKFTISKLRDIYYNVNSKRILDKYKYMDIAKIIIEAETMIIDSRANRITRIDKYIEFSKSQGYKDLLNFARFLQMIEYEFLLNSDTSKEKLYEKLIDIIQTSFQNIDDKSFPRFELHYQPKYSYEKKIVGAEALIRLRMSETELLYPNVFLEHINEARLEKELDIWVLKNTVKIVKELKRNLPDNFEISINVSPSTIADYRYIELFNSLVKQYNIEEILSIEIIETWNHEEDDHIKTHYRLGELNSKTKISIDDFGSGTTMLDYIVMISNLSAIKLDKSLIDKLETKNESKALALINGINKLAEITNLNVVAEGIETDKQFNLLKDIGIKTFQGYYFSKPVALDEFKKLLKQND